MNILNGYAADRLLSFGFLSLSLSTRKAAIRLLDWIDQERHLTPTLIKATPVSLLRKSNCVQHLRGYARSRWQKPLEIA